MNQWNNRRTVEQTKITITNHSKYNNINKNNNDDDDDDMKKNM